MSTPPAPLQQFQDIFPAAFQTLPAPELPDRANLKTVRAAIAGALAQTPAQEVAEECERFGLAPPQDGEDPWKGKIRYIEKKLREFSLQQLVALGHRVNEEHPSTELEHVLSLAGVGGVAGDLKNLIFAANGPKPKIVLLDAVNNDIQITKNAEHCLVYNRSLPADGLSWRALVSWWADTETIPAETERETAGTLYRRLMASMEGNGAEQFLFQQYCSLYGAHGFDLPALIPQVYLHYDPYTKRHGGTLPRQRMDFLLLLPNRRRVVLELDGVQHYADPDGRAKPRLYAEMVAEDRRLRLTGYEVYRFGGFEFVNRDQAGTMLNGFFRELLQL
ncbi:hypothetical protein [Paeniglutamicibacter cryotolerans]|uniref:AbiJ-NTD3 domain-containing protein n=1 Tax=Paeniglutamicibacter cryotolerans TaxID=670079 RepID=A0A839R088_9MICC|nr:hypothetical protein [Paeniglutamicibacter cryotolerans]MBB2997661.1 hypothetical protein [Paeniglutamicibacter cryotolerans]